MDNHIATVVRVMNTRLHQEAKMLHKIKEVRIELVTLFCLLGAP